MAKGRKSTQLAGLAALVGLGYKLLNQGERRGDVSVDERSARSDAAQAAPSVAVRPAVDVDESGLGGFGSMGLSGPLAETGGMGRTNVTAASQADMAPPNLAAVVATPARIAGTDRSAGAGRPAGGSAAPARSVVDPIAAAYADESRRRDILAQQAAAGRSRSFAGQTGDAPASLPRGQAAVDMIPGESRRAPQGGERVTGTEFSRNLGNLLNAPVPGVLPLGRAVRGAGAALRQPPTAVPALAAPAARLTGPSRAAIKDAERIARQEKLREQVLRENAANYGLDPTAPGYEAAMRALRSNLGGKDFTLKKKGGAVKAKPQKMASGGMSSASKRADGIASKGKTKCKMY